MADCFLMKNGGSGTSFTYGENIFDFEKFKTGIISSSVPVYNGTIKWIDNGFILTSTNNNCYTNDWHGPLQIDCLPYKYYEISFNCSSDTNIVHYVFLGKQRITYYYTNNRFLFTTPSLDATNYLIARFGIETSGESVTFTDIKIREVLSLGD